MDGWSWRSTFHDLCRAMDAGADALVGRAAADVPVHGVVNVAVARGGFSGQERGRRHDLPRLAIAALWHVELSPRGAHRLDGFPLEALNRYDFHLGGVGQ